MPMKRRIAIADHHDVYRHLAAEELLLDALPGATTVLYLWSTTKAIVIGKNQNPWLECNLPAMTTSDCRLSRRISGGGTVFHDTGNLNYAFFTNRDSYDRTAFSEIVLQAVRSFDVPCEIGPRHLLQAEGRKFSGNAFCIRRGKVLHHGTLLVTADLSDLQKLLTPSCCGIEAKGIRSVPSDVVNLAELCPEMTVERLKERLVESFAPTESPIPVDFTELNDRTALFAADAWLYHRTPRFTATGRLTHVPTTPTFTVTVVSGMIAECLVDDSAADGIEYVGLDFRDFLAHTSELALT